MDLFVPRKRPEKWKNRFVLHYDIAPCHTSLVIFQFLADKKLPSALFRHTRQTWHPVISGDSQKIKLAMKGNRFDTIPEIETATKEP
jgi:hypothetical protein